MFGFSFSELVVLVIVALIVIGPKDLPKVLRKLGMWAGKLRRMASDLRAQSGIDDVLRTEGLSEDIAEIRKLARGELDDVRRAVSTPFDPGKATAAQDPFTDIDVDPQREYPREGADGYMALPDTAILYADTFPKSAFARDALYMLGDANAKLPEEEGDKKDNGADADVATTATSTSTSTSTPTSTSIPTSTSTSTRAATLAEAEAEAEAEMAEEIEAARTADPLP